MIIKDEVEEEVEEIVNRLVKKYTIDNVTVAILRKLGYLYYSYGMTYGGIRGYGLYVQTSKKISKKLSDVAEFVDSRYIE